MTRPPRLLLLRTKDDGEHWLTVSDMMAGLMMVFLLIAVALMEEVTSAQEREQDQCRAIQRSLEQALTASKLQGDAEMLWKQSDTEGNACANLCYVFVSDIPDPSNTSESSDILDALSATKSPTPLFERDERTPTEDGRKILETLLPHFLKNVHGFEDVIREVRVGGHTSCEWTRNECLDPNTPEGTADYFGNLTLSQERAHSVLKLISDFVRDRRHLTPDVADEHFDLDVQWVHERFVAVGYSSSRRLKKGGGALQRGDGPEIEDRVRSRRFDFCVSYGDDPRRRDAEKS